MARTAIVVAPDTSISSTPGRPAESAVRTADDSNPASASERPRMLPTTPDRVSADVALGEA